VAVVAGPVGDVLDQATVRSRRIGPQLVEEGADGLDDLDVGLLVPAADVVRFADAAPGEHLADRRAVIPAAVMRTSGEEVMPAVSHTRRAAARWVRPLLDLADSRASHQRFHPANQGAARKPMPSMIWLLEGIPWR